MQIAYELTQKDFIEAYSAHRNRSPLSKWSRRIFICIAGLSTAVIALGFLVKPSVQAAKALLPFFGLFAAWILILWVLPRWTMRRQFLRQPGAHGPRTVLFDASGAHWRFDGGSSDIEWRNYIRSVEGKNQILFYTSPACFNILPKRAIAAEQLSEIRLLLKQSIQTRK
ncbi:MAG: YcxB family protein [Terriglobales bacterium]